MNFTIKPDPRFFFDLCKQHTDVLLKLAERATDKRLHDAGQPGGFISHWAKQEDRKMQINASIHEIRAALDLMKNVDESFASSIVPLMDMCLLFNSMLSAWEHQEKDWGISSGKNCFSS